MRDPVSVLHLCADEVRGTKGEAQLRALAAKLERGVSVFSVRSDLYDMLSFGAAFYSPDEIAAFRLAREGTEV